MNIIQVLFLILQGAVFLVEIPAPVIFPKVWLIRTAFCPHKTYILSAKVHHFTNP